ncbi:hypothetical protein [Paracidovorax wautersii]|uniref:Uncharacterized protein n=1 Tax=Paracidovorax wautersii TaxID=1177982 RepID=A0A1I2GCN4_9BURK|nr:hypothetical protein [Paracidovorax wautersii]SFF14760.1 hypothetical protein SAMN04489711_11459 [Paracidovorax wautersii]
MSMTLTNGSTPLALPQDLIWTDELTWSPVAQKTERGIFGTLIIDAMARNGGRPITLQGDGDSAWISRAALRTLRSWASIPGLRLALDVRGQAFTVVFDHGDAEEGRALAMSAVIDYADPLDTDYYCSLTLRFLEASETP